MRPLLLDMFCGEGGASIGFAQAGFDVVGIDKRRWKRYPFPLIVQDIRKLTIDLSRFDAIHASPPCQAHSPLRASWDIEYENLLPLTRQLLADFDGPWSIENVVGSWLAGSVTLCGAAMGCSVQRPRKLVLRRHRLFACSFAVDPPRCQCERYKAEGYEFLQVHGTGTHTPGDGIAIRRRLMGLPNASAGGIAQSIPPSYTRFIGREMLALMDRRHS